MGQELQPITATTRLDTNSILIGDQARLKLQVEYNNQVSVIWPDVPDTLGKTEIVKRSKIDTAQDNAGYTSLSQEFWITSFDSGSHTIPNLKVRYSLKDDTISKVVLTNNHILRVNGIAVDTTKEIMDIKPPISVPFSLWQYLRENYKLVIGILFVITAAILVYYYLKKRKRKPAITKPIPKAPPYEMAIEALRKIEHERAWQRGEYKFYHSSIADTIRHYISGRYQIAAMELTTDEIIWSLKHISANEKNMLLQILSFADLVKFAKSQPLPFENERSLNNAYEFLNSTRPTLESLNQAPIPNQ